MLIHIQDFDLKLNNIGNENYISNDFNDKFI